MTHCRVFGTCSLIKEKPLFFKDLNIDHGVQRLGVKLLTSTTIWIKSDCDISQQKSYRKTVQNSIYKS